jgi:energy-coupling factor transport system ATP-binding protein
MIVFNNVALSYQTVEGTHHAIFKALNLTIKRGEKVAIVGANGAGKSTLLKLIIGLLKTGGGTILVDGASIQNQGPEAISSKVSLVYQNPEEMFIMDSIESDIAYAMQARSVNNWQEQTENLMARFNLTALKSRDGRLLSGGQMRRASLAIGIALQPKVLLLDEPTANLDVATRKEILKTLNDIKGITETVLIATHDMQLVCEWADRVIVLEKGEVVADGTRDDIFSNSAVTQRVGLRPPQIFEMAKALDERALCYTIDAFEHAFMSGRF